MTERIGDSDETLLFADYILHMGRNGDGTHEVLKVEGILPGSVIVSSEDGENLHLTYEELMNGDYVEVSEPEVATDLDIIKELKPSQSVQGHMNFVHRRVGDLWGPI